MIFTSYTWFLPAIPSCWVHRLLTVLYDCHFELNTFSHHLLCRWQSALRMTELKPQELRTVHWQYITISRYLLSTLDLAVISSSKSLSICPSLWLFSQNTLCLHFLKKALERISLSKSRPPSVKFNSLTICTSHCLAASSGYHLFCALSCEHVCQWCERKSCLKQL